MEKKNSIDTFPLPVCVPARGKLGRRFPWEAYFDIAPQNYYEFKLGLRISRLGMITYYALLPSRPHDIQSMDIVLEEFSAPSDP